MSLDHYVSQVHLKHFYSPALADLMYAVRKSDLKTFQCNSKSVCRIEGGSTNEYLQRDRLIEEFLLYVEPKYNESLAKLRNNTIDHDCILSISGFVAYVMGSSPAGMRILSEPLRASLETTSAILDRRGDIPPSPELLGGKSLTELLAAGTVQFKIDPKYPQALGITSIIAWVSVFGNSHWEIIRNEIADTPFFTSDYPVGLERSLDPRVLNRIIPLAPDVAIRICPDIRLSGERPDLTFRKFSSKQLKLRRPETIEINRCLVRCAEDCVFYRDNFDWILPFVSKNRHYRVEGITQRFPQGRGFLNVSTQRIASTRESVLRLSDA
jgi:hypothetical protein